MRGTELLNELTSATGLPDDLIGNELTRLVQTAGKAADEVTLDDLRDMLATYLQDILLGAKEGFEGEQQGELQEAATSLNNAVPLRAATPAPATHSSNVSTLPTFTMFSSLGTSAPDFIGEG